MAQSLDVYYEQKLDGSFVVHFPNNRGWSIKEVETLFSPYGKVLSVSDRGEARGLCFVRYGSVDEVKRCLDGFQGGKVIKILPHKNKLKLYQNQTHTPMWTQVKLSQSDGIKSMQTKYQTTKQDKNDCVSITNSVHSKRSYSSNLSNKNISSNGSMKVAIETGITKVQQLLKLKTSMSSSVSSVATSNKATRPNDVVEKIPQLINTDEYISDQSALSSDTDYELQLKSRVLPAQEVIVANVHSSFGVHYILHLLENYHPISVSLMKIVPNTSIRYCNVYFETLEEAMGTQREFDNLSLCGHKLLVLTQATLLEQSLT